jgi:heat shock protein HslJ
MSRASLLFIALIALSGCREQRQQLGQALSGQPPVIAGTLVGDWQVADLNGGGAIARAMLRFEAERVSGTVGCNRFMGGWKQDGQAISFGAMAITRMACPPPVMDTERRVLGLLQAATTVRFTQDGEAIVTAAGGRTLTLRRAPQP